MTPNSILRGGINITSLSPLSTTDIERVEVLKEYQLPFSLDKGNRVG
uniref:Uncharacterized protein n=1 Tax=Desertifilum tharense IPPAS B-1220 TaxID=1781255 RepID=A0ACD5GNP0_9CYAN